MMQIWARVEISFFHEPLTGKDSRRNWLSGA